jgi:hypothetical protein
MSMRRALVVVAPLALAFASPATARAQARPAIEEARSRFDRAIRLFNDGDNAAALAELQRAYEIAPSPVVLYNIAIVSAAMGRSVAAVDALERLLPAPGSLSRERIDRARAVLAEQAARVATLIVTANVEGAAFEVDNILVAKADLGKPLRVTSGTHVVGAVAPGHAPQRKEVSVAGRAEATVTFELVPMQGRLAHLRLATRLSGADLIVDGQPAGKTPLPANLALAPGQHALELRRTGYVAKQREVTLGDGATGEVTLDLDEDPSAIAREGGTLALAISESQAIITIDGQSKGGTTTLRLAPGVHVVRVERAGFATVEREADVPARGTLAIAVVLEPNPDTLASYVERTERRRTAGIVMLAAGGALGAAGGAFLGYNAGPKSNAQTALDTAIASMTGVCAVNNTGGDAKKCNAYRQNALDDLNTFKERDAIGYVGIGVGGAAIVTGIVLLAGGDDPHRYDRKPSGETLARALPFIWRAPGGGGLGWAGTF